jgi:hypothetical protein
MATKSGVSNIFPQFKKFVETRFQKPIKTLYSENILKTQRLLLAIFHGYIV